MSASTTARILICGTLVAGGVVVTATFPPAAVWTLASAGATASLASNIFASDIFATLQSRAFDPHTADDVGRVVGEAIGAALEHAAADLCWLCSDRRRLRKLAKVARTSWLTSPNLSGAFKQINSERAIEWLLCGVSSRSSSPHIFERPEEWLQVIGELGRLAKGPKLPSQSKQHEVARYLHEQFPVLVRNIVKGDPTQAGSNRPFAALQLDFMQITMAAQREVCQRLGEQQTLAKSALSKLDEIREAVTIQKEKLTAILSDTEREQLQGLFFRVEALGEEVHRFIVETRHQLDRIEQNTHDILSIARRMAGRMGLSTESPSNESRFARSLVSASPPATRGGVPLPPFEQPHLSPNVRDAWVHQQELEQHLKSDLYKAVCLADSVVLPWLEANGTALPPDIHGRLLSLLADVRIEQSKREEVTSMKELRRTEARVLIERARNVAGQ
ncbi:MAG TPA: hypothetical protein VF669_01660 [Tepidisphaeraceae bacterium]|jgi:signal transduction histidine kinase